MNQCDSWQPIGAVALRIVEDVMRANSPVLPFIRDAAAVAAAADELPVHPDADIFPMLDAEALADLAQSIKENGLREPIVLGKWLDSDDDDAKQIEGLIDGRNRLAACRQAGVQPRFRKFEGDIKAYIADQNLRRRHLTKGQQAMALALIYPEPEKGGRGKVKERVEETSTLFSAKLLQQSRAVLRHSRALALSVFAGNPSLDEALKQIDDEIKQHQAPAVRLDRLRERYPDLAAKVVEQEIGIAAAEVEANDRDGKEAKRREIMLDTSDKALFNLTAFAADEFFAGLAERLAEPAFARRYIDKLRITTEAIDGHIELLRAGCDNLIGILELLKENNDGPSSRPAAA